MKGRRLAAALLATALLALAGCSSTGPDTETDAGPDTGSPTGSPTGRPDTGRPRTDRPESGPARGGTPSPERTTAPPGDGKRAGPWRPRPGTRWQWQLDGRVDTGVDVPVYDIDGFENEARTVAELHARGRKVICYINAGAWESFRPDSSAFPASVLGRNNGWDGEKWLDIRRLDVLRPIMADRIEMCRKKGFDAVEPDLTEGYRNNTGFPLTAAHQLAFNRMIARLAHDRGLSVGLKNDLEQIPELVADFDFAVNEQCAEHDECESLRPFVEGGKAVFHVEYELETGDFCREAGQLGLSSMRKRLGLDAWRKPC
ncbi:endo alpha-1,4 polygalactosaminidase [Streptomyces stramineus]|uniref:Endo alpha-1,4 polygalactosaminidase n=1 Tax=Streptomyces stramineus TaxID=173861 RepID=A0ABP3KXI6_9ACTN